MSTRQPIDRFWLYSSIVFMIIAGLLIGVAGEHNKKLRLQCEALGGTFNSDRGGAICFAPGATYPLKKG